MDGKKRQSKQYTTREHRQTSIRIGRLPYDTLLLVFKVKSPRSLTQLHHLVARLPLSPRPPPHSAPVTPNMRSDEDGAAMDGVSLQA